MNTGSIILSDSSRHVNGSGNVGFSFFIAPFDNNYITSIIYDSTTVAGDQTFLQQQIIGPGNLTLILQEWGYFGGIQIDATTYSGGRWGTRWFDPSYIKYSIWYLDYDSSQYSLIGYQQRTPVEASVGSFYAPMVVPDPPGHYQIRWLYLKDNSGSYGSQTINSFTSVSRGLDAMKDYPYASGWLSYPYGNIAEDTGALVMTVPVYQYKNLGETAVFTLQFNGPVPAPLIYLWRFNGSTIYDGLKYTGTTTNTLVIKDLKAVDGGIYTCVVSNVIVSTYAFLVMDPP